MTDMTPEQLAEIAARLAAATPGPWYRKEMNGYTDDYVETSHPDYQTKPHGQHIADVGYAAGHPKQNFSNNAEFIAHAPTDIAALIAEFKRLCKFETDALPILDAYEHMHTRALRAEDRLEQSDD